MALKKPVVVYDGQLGQIQAGDTLDAPIIEQEVVQLVNGESSPISICQPVYISGAGQVKLAKADASGTKDVIGLVKEASINASESGAILTGGVLNATTGQWDTVTGGTGGLTPNAIYYLDPGNAGKLTTVAPITISQYVAQVGIAISTVDLKLDPMLTILL